jgi:gamma-glutamylcyclotransferase (GGCT)/AIG2-like uncharacterized protein YtfP
VPRHDEDSTLFVYGSLVDHARRIELLGRPVAITPATLRDYAIGRARYFYIIRQTDPVTAGLLLLELKARDFIALDRYEETPTLYTREKIEVIDAAGQPQQCWVYLPTRRLLHGRCD